jgi:hypothetical protein
MSKHVLRNFRYLNSNLVDSYLAQFEGEFLADDYHRKDTVSDDKGIGLDIKTPFIGGSGKAGGSSSSEFEFTLRDTPEIKFNRLHEVLEREKLIQPLNGLDQKIYDQIEPDELVQVRGKAHLPELEHLKGAMTGFSYVIEWMKKYTPGIVNDEELQQYEGFKEIASQGDEDGIMLIIASIGSPRYKFVAKLDPDCIRGRKEGLEVEVTVVGQVLRRLTQGAEIEVYPLLKQIAYMQKMQNSNRQQKRAATKPSPTSTPLDEVVKYPAIEIQPIAIFQQVISRQS